MNIDLTNLSGQQILVTLLMLAILDAVTGIGTAIKRGVVIYTYLGNWALSNLLPALVIWTVAVAGKGIPAIQLTPDPVIWLIFLGAAATYTAAQLASIASNLGYPLTNLPFTSGLTGGKTPADPKPPTAQLQS